MPIDKLLTLVASTDIDAYQISSLSQASVYRDGAAEKEAETWRRFETTPAVPIAAARTDEHKLPVSPVERSRESGYTGEDDVGLVEWKRAHPTFDGRGVTIAMLESAKPEWVHPTIGHAKSLDGRKIPKIAAS